MCSSDLGGIGLGEGGGGQHGEGRGRQRKHQALHGNLLQEQEGDYASGWCSALIPMGNMLIAGGAKGVSKLQISEPSTTEDCCACLLVHGEAV